MGCLFSGFWPGPPQVPILLTCCTLEAFLGKVSSLIMSVYIFDDVIRIGFWSVNYPPLT